MTRKFVDAEEAVQWGFVTKVVAHDQAHGGRGSKSLSRKKKTGV
jgi:enoyl-CoA hydratase/carnithine racemase